MTAKKSTGHIVVGTGCGLTDGLGFVCVLTVSIVSTHGVIKHLAARVSNKLVFMKFFVK